MARILVIVAVVAVVAGGLAYVRSGSGTPQTEAVDTSGDAALLTVTTSPMFITLENRAGMALKDVKVSIVPVGRATVFSAAMISRIETNLKRTVSLGEFRGRDGTPLNMRIHKPQTVTVTAERVDGKPVQVEVPWK